MKSHNIKKYGFLFLSFIWFYVGVLFCQVPVRFFDSTELNREKIKIAIFYSHQGSWKVLHELNKKIDSLGLEKMMVVFVYHKKESIDYKEAHEFVERNKIGWIKFHQIRAPFNRNIIFQKSAISDEFEKIFTKSDGVIFFGGYDIPAYIYHKKTSFLTDIIYPYRHFTEISAVFHLLGGFQDKNFQGFLEKEPDFPVLGICLGCQTLNVGTGGSLVQDIWSDKYRKKYVEDVLDIPRENWHKNPFAILHPEEKYLLYTLHPIKLDIEGKFCAEMGFSSGDKPLVLSGHHQALDKLGKGLKIIATSIDGKVVEAVEHEKYANVLGIQFHPDHPYLWDPDVKFKSTPEEKKAKSLVSVLTENPPSFEFNLKIWSWFKQKLREYHEKKKYLP